MTTPSQQKPASITCADIETVARQGVARAVAARQNITELSPEQAGEVGGGLLLKSPIIYGGFFSSMINVATVVATPTAY